MSSSSSVASMAWDPKATSSLLVPFVSDGKLEFTTFYANDGIGAHPVETSALLKILTSSPVQKNYRRVLHSCIDEMLEVEDPLNAASLELLKLLYAVTHLTETHVLQTPTMADTIPYLRLHHMETLDIYDIIEKTRHPEELQAYWTMLRKLVIRGCLEDAWSMLTYHSACQRAFAAVDSSRDLLPIDAHHAQQLEYDRQGFLALRAILLSAPLPGGRTDLYDAGDDQVEAEEDNDVPLMIGVRPLDYKLWKTNPHAALASWRTWRSQIETVTAFLRREPRLLPIMQILLGDFSVQVFDDWSEALCAELLYIRPHLRAEDLPIRMARTMESFGEPPSVILSILQGDYGAIVESLYTKLGGGSGAALPATMTALICNLLVDAKRLPDKFDHVQTNLLLEAADAILSSHTNTDIGMRLTALLLIPHCSSKRDLRITATLAEALERHCPNTDSEAHLLLDLVTPLVTKKNSVRILDGCVSMIVGRYRQLLSAAKKPGLAMVESKMAMDWLVVGNELEAALVGQGVCYRLIVTCCQETSFTLLQQLLGKEVGEDSSRILAAQGYTDALHDKLEDVPAVRLLDSMTVIAIAVMEKRQDRSTIGATNIAKCLRGLAMPSMHWDLLTLAKKIIDVDFERYGVSDKGSFESSFSVQDMHALMESFVLLTTLNEEPLDGENEMKLALANGLMLAFIRDNAQLKEPGPQPRTDVSTLRSTLIETYSVADQELLVSSMLDLY